MLAEARRLNMAFCIQLAVKSLFLFINLLLSFNAAVAAYHVYLFESRFVSESVKHIAKGLDCHRLKLNFGCAYIE